MRGYTTNYVNLIADNLRDRYQNGFPILKELIQNADDAKARSFIFGRHPGFPDSRHPLLKGSGLWIFNDGKFKKSDADGLRSFGIGAKAGDARAIGKFGLGMKSVFHLCEALFYVAWDGLDLHCDGLTPWKQDGHTLHQEWDQTDDSDWNRLRDIGQKLAADSDEACSWFLLWLPLRTKAHLLTQASQETEAIISRFPGDDPAGELAFLDDEKLAYDVAEILPLLQHLERVEHRAENNRFTLQLARGPRLLGDQSLSQASGEVRFLNGYSPLAFSGLRSKSSDAWFADMKSRAEWPRTRYRDELGRERQAPDKTSPEAAVTFCSSRGEKNCSRLHWAVFLPVEDNSEGLGIDRAERAYSLVLHGQFFLDAGRKKIHDLEVLGDDPVRLDGTFVDESLLRRAWNQRLAQAVLLPLVLPALELHAKQQKLSDNECSFLTESIRRSNFFSSLRQHVCRDGTWLRTLQRGADRRWRLVEGDRRSRLRPLPKAPNSAPDRPWKVFPNLNDSNVVPYDVTAPRLGLSDKPGEWPEEELENLLSRVDGLFVDAPSMDYLIEFLESCAGPHKTSEQIQHRLLVMMRTGLRTSGLATRRQVAAKASRLASFLQPEVRLEISSEFPEWILRGLWEIDAPVLLVPKGMDPEPRGMASPGVETLAAWLEVLDGALDSTDEGSAQPPILAAIQGLLRALPDDARRQFLQTNPALRVIGVREVQSAADKPISIDYLDRIRADGTLFRFSAGLRSEAMGIAPLLARAIPDADVCLVSAQNYRSLIPDDDTHGGDYPIASDGQACLAAVGQHTGRLGNIAERRDLLERANDPGTDAMALRGLRFLLHGSPDHRADDHARLWIGRHSQHPAWRRLWTAMHPSGQWSLVPEELADAVPRNRWTQAKIAEIDAQTLLDDLGTTGQELEKPEAFSVEERNEILSRIENEDLWLRLPVHTTVDGRPVSASERVYLAPPTLDREDRLTREATLIASSENAHVADKQRRWLRPLNYVARIEIALGTPNPARYWRSIMNALNQSPDDVPKDLGDLLRNTVWLPTTHGAPVKPEDVIDLQDTLQDEAHRLVAEHRLSHGPCFAVPDDIDAEVQEHEAWPLIRKTGFSSDSQGLDRLSLLLEDLPNRRIGSWPTQPEPEVTELLASYDDLPGWRLLRMAAESLDLETAWARLEPVLSQAISVEKLAKVLGWLTRDSDRWQIRKSAHDVYLRQLAMTGQSAAELLSDLRLASADGSWRNSAELCAGAHGIVRASLLDTRQESILANLVCRAGARVEDDRVDASHVPPDGAFRQYRNTLLYDLRGYFQSWDANLVPTPTIGVVLALLGPAVRGLAKKYLHPRSFEWLVQQLPWRDPGRTRERIEWMGEKTADEALELIEAAVEVQTGDNVKVLNLLGENFQVPLDQNPATLLAGHLNWRGGYGVMIPLRRIDPDRYQPERLGEILRATAEGLYDMLYNQGGADLSVLWAELNRTDQLEIGIARRLILDHIPFYLRQLSVKCEPIERQLAICDRLRRRIAEAEADSGQSAESARNELRESLDELADLIDRNPVDQQAILEAVKGKLEQYQYDLSSIPLELFQNADDAAVELGQFHALRVKGCQVPSAARRFLVDEREDGLGFLHWGRPVNARGPVGFDGEARGYDRDLENMLILSATDKPGDDGVTGKFGLGFKSVLLACKQPRILSGRLAVRVVAGILPQSWDDANEARQRLINVGEDSSVPGTIIDLPGLDGEQRDHILGRFRRLAGIFCVFGRAIRTIVHIGAASETVFRWQPSETCPGVEIGDLDLRGDWGVRTRALCVRTDNGSVLMAIGPQGFRAMPDCVPVFWVTAPTRESSAVGFAVNGSFDIDAGRGRLAGNPDNNRKKAKRIGSQSGITLGALLERSRNDWGSVQSDLGLAADLNALDFWESIWLGLTKGWLKRHRGDEEDLVREVALAAITRLCDRPCAVPNGLKGPLRQFSDAREIRYELRGTLLSENVGSELGAWERFTNRYPSKICVSGGIANILREADLQTPQPLGLSALVGLLEHSRVQPVDAEVLGRLYLLTEDTPDWASKDLSERLKMLLFRSEADTWVESRKLLACRGSDFDPDEPRRHALAPLEYRLHSDYYTESTDERPAVAFFLVCRQRMEAPADKIAQWVLNAVSVEERRTALGYLADGELGERVAEHVREQEWLRNALHDPDLTAGLTEEQRDRLRRRLIPRTHLKWAVVQNDDSEYELTHSYVELPIALEKLYQWWANEGHERAAEHRNRIYPQDHRNLNLKSDPEVGSPDRSSWFMLLALGSFQGIGRKEEQHRDFVRRCQNKGWWEIFTECDPAKEPEKWMNIIEAYAEAQHEDEEWTQWLAQFPKLYRLRRWLDDYIDLFLSLNRFDDPFTRDEILAPRSNHHFQGGGIDAPPLTRTLKVGFPFVVRELLHDGVIGNSLAAPHAYAPIDRVKRFFQEFGCEVATSEDIHKILNEHLGAERATFTGDYDIPLRIISMPSNASLREQLLE